MGVEDALYGNVRMTSRPAKREVERLLVEVVDMATSLVRDAALLDPEHEPLAGIGLTGVSQSDWTPYDGEEESFLEVARLSTELGRMLSPNLFLALFLALIEARKRFKAYASVHLTGAARLRRSLLAEAVDRFLFASMVSWDACSAAIQLQIQGPDEEEESEWEEEEWEEDEVIEENEEAEEDGDVVMQEVVVRGGRSSV